MSQPKQTTSRAVWVCPGTTQWCGRVMPVHETVCPSCGLPREKQGRHTKRPAPDDKSVVGRLL
jgi:hypothetical protein